MRCLIQKCLNASVTINNNIVGKIDYGYVVFVGFTYGDNSDTIKNMVNKILNLRIIEDSNGVMNVNILDHGGSILSISQFTLYADTKKGNRPSYINAMKGEESIKLYEEFNNELRKYINIETGVFGEDMKVSLINDGPCTIMLEK